MKQHKAYDEEYKIQAVKIGREISFSKAVKELGINVDTLYCWNKQAKDVRLDFGLGTQTSETAKSLTEEVQMLRQQNKVKAKEMSQFGITTCCPLSCCASADRREKTTTVCSGFWMCCSPTRPMKRKSGRYYRKITTFR